MKTKKSIYNIIASLIYKVLTCVIGILIPRFFVVNYGSELNGLQSSVTQIFSYIALIEAGVGEAALQSLFKPIANKDHNGSNSILAATTFYYNKIGVIYFFILIVLSLLYPLVVKVNDVSFFTVVAYIFFAGASTGINFFYQAKILLVIQAEGDSYINFYISMIVYILSSIIKIVCIFLGLNIVIIQLGHFAVNLLLTLSYYLIAKKKYPWINFKAKPNMVSISQKNSVMVHKISGLIFHNVDILLLTFFCGLQVVSVYSMYKLVINMITTIIASFSDSFNYIFGQTYNTKPKEDYCKIIDTFNVFYSALAMAIFSVAYVLLLPFLRLYTDGMDINYIFKWLPLLYLIIEILQIGRESMLRTITVAGRFKDTTYSAIIELSINVVATIGGILICKYVWGNETGIYGALVGTICALLYRTLDINYFANKKILGRSPYKTNRVLMINSFIFVVLALIFTQFKFEINNYFDFAIHGIVISVILLVVYIFIHALLNKNEVAFAINLIKTKFLKIGKNFCF